MGNVRLQGIIQLECVELQKTSPPAVVCKWRYRHFEKSESLEKMVDKLHADFPKHTSFENSETRSLYWYQEMRTLKIFLEKCLFLKKIIL